MADDQSEKAADEAKLESLAKRMLAMPPKPHEPNKPKATKPKKNRPAK